MPREIPASASLLGMRGLFLVLATFSIAAAQAPHGPHQAPHPHHRRSAEEWQKILEREDRREWQKPEEVVAALGLEQDDHVADIGAGSGYFSVRFARAVGPEGKVYAVDIQQDLIDLLADRAEREGLPNLVPVLGAADNPRLPATVDWIFICDVAHHLEDRPTYYARLRHALDPQGRLAVIDFHKRETPVGPSVESRISRDQMIAELEQAGFRLAAEHDFLPYQYFLIFEASR